LLEGPAGVGKTQIAKTLAELQDTKLIRLQCYEGLDASHAIYEWNYQRQLLSIRAASEEHKPSDEIEDHIFSENSCCNGRCWKRSGRTSPPCC
jgi:MoxR-like ATPase